MLDRIKRINKKFRDHMEILMPLSAIDETTRLENQQKQKFEQYYEQFQHKEQTLFLTTTHIHYFQVDVVHSPA